MREKIKPHLILEMLDWQHIDLSIRDDFIQIQRSSTVHIKIKD